MCPRVSKWLSSHAPCLWEVITLKNAVVLVVPISGAYWLYLFSKSLPIKIEHAPNGHQALYHLCCIGNQGHDPSSAQKAWYQVHTWPHSDRSEEIKHSKKVKTERWLTSKGTPLPQAEGSGGAIGVKGLRIANPKQRGRAFLFWEKMSRWGLR